MNLAFEYRGQYSPVHQKLVDLARRGMLVLRNNEYRFRVRRWLRTDYLVLLPEQAAALADLLDWGILIAPIQSGLPITMCHAAG